MDLPMTTVTDSHIPPALRARLLADYRAVRPLPHPWARALSFAPFALLALVAAPWWFELRMDHARLGWFQSWGWSIAQSLAGMVLVAAALRDAVPGRTWRSGQLALWLALPAGLVIVVTWTTFGLSPITLRGARPLLVVGAMCFAGSLATALPGAALAAILAIRAFPTRPAVTGLLGGLGAGLMADAGWRLFCHFSDPAHVLSAHLGGVLAAGACGAVLARRLHGRRDHEAF
jgi:hypothetical protein